MNNYENPGERMTASLAIRKGFVKNMFWYVPKENFANGRVVDRSMSGRVKSVCKDLVT